MGLHKATDASLGKPEDDSVAVAVNGPIINSPIAVCCVPAHEAAMQLKPRRVKQCQVPFFWEAEWEFSFGWRFADGLWLLFCWDCLEH